MCVMFKINKSSRDTYRIGPRPYSVVIDGDHSKKPPAAVVDSSVGVSVGSLSTTDSRNALNTSISTDLFYMTVITAEAA